MCLCVEQGAGGQRAAEAQDQGNGAAAKGCEEGHFLWRLPDRIWQQWWWWWQWWYRRPQDINAHFPEPPGKIQIQLRKKKTNEFTVSCWTLDGQLRGQACSRILEVITVVREPLV